jgi:hypothetical protein
MLKIRSAQLDALSRQRLEGFVDEATGVVSRHWKEQVEQLGPAATRERVLEAVLQAQDLGIVRREDTLRFLNVVFALGADFVEKFAWAGRIVTNLRLKPDVRMSLLSERTASYLEGFEVE